MADKKFTFPTIPEPTADPAALLQTLQAMRQVVQTLTGQRNTNTPSVVDQLAEANTKLNRIQSSSRSMGNPPRASLMRCRRKPTASRQAAS